jgi:hypothetical protein
MRTFVNACAELAVGCLRLHAPPAAPVQFGCGSFPVERLTPRAAPLQAS